MKYLLKFVIETWSLLPVSTREDNLIFEVEFDDEIVKKDGILITKATHYCIRQSFRCKYCKRLEGPEEIHSLINKKLVFCLERKENPNCPNPVVIDLEIYGECTQIRYMGCDPISDEEPQTISSPGE